MKDFIGGVLSTIAIMSLLWFASTLPTEPVRTPEPFYAVERGGMYFEYYTVWRDGAPDIKTRWTLAPKDAHRYGAWDSAADDAREWGGNVVEWPK